MLILNKTNKKTLVLIILLTFLICFSINTVTGTNLKINITDVFQTKKLMDTDNYIENKNIYKFSSYTRNYGSITRLSPIGILWQIRVWIGILL